MDLSRDVLQLIQEHRVFHCIECGKCTGACPFAQVDRDFSPRLLAKYAMEEGIHSRYVRQKAWACLTCGLCQARCPQGISFPHFVRGLRHLYERDGDDGVPASHGGALHCLMRMQAASGLAQRRLDWLTPDLRTSARGELLYFAGCLPHLDAFFSDLSVRLNHIGVATVRILNALGIAPVVLPQERCCGHDLLWSGDGESFRTLRRLNVESFRASGVSTIVTACAECSYVLKALYPEPGEPFPFHVMHLSEYLHGLAFRPGRALGRVATFQDPCRLGRFQGVYEAPRELLSSVLTLREMDHFRDGSWCCGNSAWLSCDRYSKQIQVERLLEAKSTGSDLIVTACPKCQIHLRCAMRDRNLLHDLDMEIQDLACLLAETITTQSAKRQA